MKLALLLPGYLDSPDYLHMKVFEKRLIELGYTVERLDACDLWITKDTSNYTITNFVKQIKGRVDYYKSQSPEEIVLIGHSMGGLLIRGYLSDYPGDDRVYKAMTVGTPHTGTVLAYPLWANGDIWFTELGVKIPITLLLNYCRLVKTTLNLTGISKGFVTIDVPTYKLLSQKETIQSLAPSIESLLPVFNYLQKNGNLIDSTSLISQNNWLKNHLIDNNRIKMITDTISGNNRNTLKVLSVKPPSKKDLKNKNWVDAGWHRWPGADQRRAVGRHHRQSQFGAGIKVDF